MELDKPELEEAISPKEKGDLEVCHYHSHLVFKPGLGDAVDMNLLDDSRSLIHSGKLLHKSDTGFGWNWWGELFVLLFDNYLIMTKPRHKDGMIKYRVTRRPVSLDLLTLINFTDSATQRSASILRGLRREGRHGYQPISPSGVGVYPDTPVGSRAVYPFTIHHSGGRGGFYTIYAESHEARAEWKHKLEAAIALRKSIQESNIVLEIKTFSVDTFLVPSVGTLLEKESAFMGRITCSVPFTSPDGRNLVAIGCAEGVWIGFRHDSKSIRRVLHLNMVTQCAVLEDYGIFLVLADKSLFAYRTEMLIISPSDTSHSAHRLDGTNVKFFSVGKLQGRTLVIYMMKKGLDSVFRVMEPAIGEKSEVLAEPGFRSGFCAGQSEWFRPYKDFYLPCKSHDLIFLKSKIVILCTAGFEVMDLSDFKSVTIPQKDDPRHKKLVRRCDSCRPVGMFHSADEFLLCYDEFGLYVNKHGEPIRSIEWEGRIHHVSLRHPYILLFDNRFVEIRHVETGRLVQIIFNPMHCLGESSGLDANNMFPADYPVQDALVHGVMNGPPNIAQPRPGRSVAVPQHIFELIRTVRAGP